MNIEHTKNRYEKNVTLLFKKGRNGIIHNEAYATIGKLFSYDMQYTNCSRYKKLKSIHNIDNEALLKSAIEKRDHTICKYGYEKTCAVARSIKKNTGRMR